MNARTLTELDDSRSFMVRRITKFNELYYAYNHYLWNLIDFILENNLVDEDFERIEALYKLHKE